MRHRLLALAFLLAAGVVPSPAPAADAFVQADRTPIVSKPGVGGKILRWVDRGAPLVVVRRSGEWVKLDGRRLDPPLPEAWVPAARLGPVPPGARGGASAAGEAPADFRLVIGGLPGTPFRARCRILDAGRSRGVVLRDAVPAAFQLVGDAIECRVGNLGRSGYLRAVLQDADGAAITNTQTVAANDAVALRSDGPWGAAGSFGAPAQFVFFRDMRVSGLPPIGNPVPFIGNPVPPFGNPVPPFGNPVSPFGNPVPPFGGSPVSPIGMPTPPVTRSPVPPMGMPVSSFRGSPTPSLGNPTPAFGSSPVPPFGTPVTRFRSSPTPAPGRPVPPFMGTPVTPLPQIR